MKKLTKTQVYKIREEINNIKKQKDYFFEEKNLDQGIIYGLVFGIAGNLFVTLLWELNLKYWPTTGKIIFTLIIIIPLFFTVFLYFRRFQDREKILKNYVLLEHIGSSLIKPNKKRVSKHK